MKIKKLDYLTNLLFDNYTLLNIVNNIHFNPIFIILNIHNMSNNDLLILKNELFKNNSKSMVIKSKYIRILFSSYFNFFKTACLCIYIPDMIQFLNNLKLLKNLSFFYSYNRSFSNIVNTEMLTFQYNIYSCYIMFHYIIFKLINNIILILLINLLLLVNLLKKI